MNESGLVALVAAEPEKYLPRKSLKCLNAFGAGYGRAYVEYTGEHFRDPLLNDVWWNWLNRNIQLSNEHASRLNAYSGFGLSSYVQFLAADDREAFDLYLTFREKLQADAPVLESPVAPPPPRMETISIAKVLRQLAERPIVYFGNDFSTHEVYSFVKGFLYYESQFQRSPQNKQLLENFQKWLNERYPFAASRPWSHTLHLLAMGGRNAVRSFDEHFQLFLAGESSDVLDPTHAQIIKNILKAAGNSQGE